MWTSLVALALVAGAPGDERQLVDRIVAVVNEDIITMRELEVVATQFQAQNPDADPQALLRDVMDQLIAEHLLTQQVKEAKITVTEDEVERAIKDILRQNNITEDELKQAIEVRGKSMGQYKEELESQLIRLKLVDMKVRSRVVIPESEIKAEFEKEMKNKPRDELLHIRHLFFRWSGSADAAEKKAVLARTAAARARVMKGEDFAAVAKAVSEGPTAADGGDLGEISAKGLLPEIARALKGVQPGTVTGHIETQNGVHVVKLEARTMEGPAKYADRRDQLYQELYQREVERQMKVWLDELRATSLVEIRL